MPSGTPALHTLHAVRNTESKDRDSAHESESPVAAQDFFLQYDPALFVLPNLPLSVSESNSVVLSERGNYSSQTWSQLTSLLGLSFSQKRKAIRKFTLTARILRVVSLNQHSEVFSELMHLYQEDIKAALKEAGGTMYFVIGIKFATDATVKKHGEDQRLVDSNVMVNAAQVTELGTAGSAGVGLGQVLGGRNVQKELESSWTGDIKGERAFAMQYRCVELQRRFIIRSAATTVSWSSASEEDGDEDLKTNDDDGDDDEFEVVLRNELYTETFDCLG